METQNPSRRDFLKTVGVAGTAMVVGGGTPPTMAASSPVDRKKMISALGDALIPSDPGDPGYKDLDPYGITDEVLRALPDISDADLELFNERCRGMFDGKTFLELTEPQRADYLREIVKGSAVNDPKELGTLRRVYRNTRRRVLGLYYSNFPEHQWPRDKNGMPILKPGDLHQITNPNTTQVVTAWDQVGFHGPLTWDEEERRRNVVKKIHWHENWKPF